MYFEAGPDDDNGITSPRHCLEAKAKIDPIAAPSIRPSLLLLISSTETKHSSKLILPIDYSLLCFFLLFYYSLLDEGAPG